jgi:hypothetical protein
VFHGATAEAKTSKIQEHACTLSTGFGHRDCHDWTSASIERTASGELCNEICPAAKHSKFGVTKHFDRANMPLHPLLLYEQRSQCLTLHFRKKKIILRTMSVKTEADTLPDTASVVSIEDAQNLRRPHTVLSELAKG